MNQRVLPIYQLDRYLHTVHQAVGHRRRDAMTDSISTDNVWMEEVRARCQSFINKCPDCFTSGRIKPDNLVRQPIVPRHTLERMQLDYVKLARDDYEYEYVLTLMDCYSKKAWVRGSYGVHMGLVALH